MNFKSELRTKKLLLLVMSTCCMIFGSFTLIFKDKFFATILNSVRKLYNFLLWIIVCKILIHDIAKAEPGKVVV